VIQGLAGIAGLLLLAWICSEKRGAVPWRAVGAGVVLQLLLSLLLLKLPYAKEAFSALNDLLSSVEKASQAGTSLVFGYLGGGKLPFAESEPGSSFILAFRALPLVLVISAITALLFYWGVLQRIVRGISWLLERPTSSSAWSRRRSSSGPTSRACRAASCSRSWWAAWPRSPAPCCFSTRRSSAKSFLTRSRTC
jgi:nucleoside permease NupC